MPITPLLLKKWSFIDLLTSDLDLYFRISPRVRNAVGFSNAYFGPDAKIKKQRKIALGCFFISIAENCSLLNYHPFGNPMHSVAHQQHISA